MYQRVHKSKWSNWGGIFLLLLVGGLLSGCAGLFGQSDTSPSYAAPNQFARVGAVPDDSDVPDELLFPKKLPQLEDQDRERLGDTFLKRGDYDMVLFRTTPWGMMMHAGGGSGYFDSRRVGSINMCRLRDPAFAQLCDAILAATDPGMLKTLYHRLQQYYAQQLPAIALCWGRSFFPYATAWRGVQINQLEGGLANRFTWAALEPPRSGRPTQTEPH